MTHDPSRLATVEQIVNGNDPFETVDTPLGTMQRWKAEAMLIGTTGGILNVHDLIRADTIAQATRADAAKAQTALIKDLCARVDSFEHRFDALQRGLAKAQEQRARDDAARARFDAEPLSLPPDSPSLIKSDEPPSTPVSKEPEEPLELEKNDEGELPEPLEPIAANFPEPELPKPPIVSQPVSISLNEE